MTDFDFDIGIIGGGAAGLTVASGAAQLGAKTFLVEKEKALGGDCLHYGCVPSKTLIRTAQVYHLMKNSMTFGLPAIEGLDKAPYITNKEIFYLDQLPSSMVILWTGPIAIEMAQAFCSLGTKVSVVQRSGQILIKEDKDMADEIMKVLGSEGVTFHLNASVLRVKDLGSEKEIVLKDGEGNPISLKAEKILVAMGRDPNGKVKLSTLAAAVHPYPTLGEINKRVAGTLLSQKIFSERVRKGLKFFFNLKGRACG